MIKCATFVSSKDYVRSVHPKLTNSSFNTKQLILLMTLVCCLSDCNVYLKTFWQCHIVFIEQKEDRSMLKNPTQPQHSGPLLSLLLSSWAPSLPGLEWWRGRLGDCGVEQRDLGGCEGSGWWWGMVQGSLRGAEVCRSAAEMKQMARIGAEIQGPRRWWVRVGTDERQV